MLSRRHAGPANENGDDSDVAAERRGNLMLHEVVGAWRSSLDCLDPSRPYDRDDAIASGDHLVDRLREVLPWRNVLQVHEDARVAESCGQAIAQPPRVATGVFASIADEYVRHVNVDEKCPPSPKPAAYSTSSGCAKLRSCASSSFAAVRSLPRARLA